MPDERQIAVRYVGSGVRRVPGVGLFQPGTTAFLPAPRAAELANDPEFELCGSARPVTRLRLDIGQRPGAGEPAGRSRGPELEPEAEPWLEDEEP